MFPVSGAEQLNTSGANGAARPMISQSGAYSVFESPAPYSLSGRKRFHSPAARALAFSSSPSARNAENSCADDSPPARTGEPPMSTPVRYDVVDRIAILTIDNPPVNALGPSVWEALDEAVARAARDPAAAAT